jgi:hypothetical protein
MGQQQPSRQVSWIVRCCQRVHEEDQQNKEVPVSEISCCLKAQENQENQEDQNKQEINAIEIQLIFYNLIILRIKH